MSSHPLIPDPSLTPREMAELYAAGALTPEETASFESRIRSGDPGYVSALNEVRPAMERLLNTSEPVEPPPEVRAALMARLGMGAGAGDTDLDDERPFADEHEEHEHGHAEERYAGAAAIGVSGTTIIRAATARWKPLGLRGVQYRTLLADRKANRRTIMLKMEAGSELPDHSHAGIEEVYMVSGDLSIAGQTLGPNDYIKIERGAEHGVPRTAGGCVCIVISDYVPFPMTSLLGFVWSAVKALFGRPGKK